MSFIFTSSCFLLKKLFFLVLVCSFLSDFVIVTLLARKKQDYEKTDFLHQYILRLTLQYNAVNHKLN